MVPTGRAEEDEHARWTILTWQDIAELSNIVGRACGGRTWREKALGPEAPAKQRLLHEFVWYLEEEGDAVVDALDKDNLLAFKKAFETTLGIGTRLSRAAEEADLKPSGAPDGAPEGHQY